MEYTKLGRTDLRVSVAGLGCGGGSKLGWKPGRVKSTPFVWFGQLLTSVLILLIRQVVMAPRLL